MKKLFSTLVFTVVVFIISVFLGIFSISLMGGVLAKYFMENPPPPFDVGSDGIYFSNFSLQIFYFIPILILPIIVALGFSRIFKSFRKRVYIPIILVYFFYVIAIAHLTYNAFGLR